MPQITIIQANPTEGRAEFEINGVHLPIILNQPINFQQTPNVVNAALTPIGNLQGYDWQNGEFEDQGNYNLTINELDVLFQLIGQGKEVRYRT